MRQITQIEKGFTKDNVPEFKAGDTVKVHVKIREGDKERVQVFQGTVIGRRGGGTNATFTVRKISSGVGVERVFALHSPNISKIQRVRKGKVRRAKLYYLRGLTGKSARIEEQLDDVGKAKEKKVKVSKAAKKKAKAKAETKPEPKPEKAKTKAEKPREPKEEANNE